MDFSIIMSSLKLDLLYTTTAFLTVLHLLLLRASAFDQHRYSSLPQGALIDGKTRLGSTPPSCHNRCSECHPCMAVQVPTQPSRDRVRLGLGGFVPNNRDEKEAPVSSKKYSNYKPLGWKCRCGNCLFNP